jgi:arsenate reductase-like glutaredoxin family protein
MTSYIKSPVLKRKQCAYFGFPSQSQLSKPNAVTELNMGKNPPSDSSIRRLLKQCQETDSVLHRKGAGRAGTSQEIVNRVQ